MDKLSPLVLFVWVTDFPWTQSRIRTKSHDSRGDRSGRLMRDSLQKAIGRTLMAIVSRYIGCLQLFRPSFCSMVGNQLKLHPW